MSGYSAEDERFFASPRYPNGDDKVAPVQGYPAGIPWSVHMRAYENYVKKHGAQVALIDIVGRNCRGGFHVGELDELLPGWRDEVEELGKLRAEVKRLNDIVNSIATSEPRLLDAIRATINIHSRENVSNTPDFVLASFLMNCLAAYEAATHERDKWYRMSPIPGQGVRLS